MAEAQPTVREDLRAWLKETPGKTLVALLLAPVLTTLALRVGRAKVFQAVVPASRVEPLYAWGLVFALHVTLLYLIPVAIIKLAFKERLADYGHRLRPVARLWLLVLLFLAVMLPLTYLASRQPTFHDFYPLYRGAYRGWDRFLVFEAGIFLIFFAQEFFFRGFVIEALRPDLGKTAILVSAAMYGIGHSTKPLPEQLGAFVVGTLLGYIAYRYRTFYFGVIVHYLIALSMDAWVVVPALLR